jgi:ankyrin repeat protein
MDNSSDKFLFNKIISMSELDITDEDGNTYLHHLVNRGNKGYVNDFLNKCGKKKLFSNIINKVNNNNESPLFLAVKNNDQDIAQLLYNKGANTKIINKDGLCVSFKNIKKSDKKIKNIIYGERTI